MTNVPGKSPGTSRSTQPAFLPGPSPADRTRGRGWHKPKAPLKPHSSNTAPADIPWATGESCCICRCQQHKAPRAFTRKLNFIPPLICTLLQEPWAGRICASAGQMISWWQPVIYSSPWGFGKEQERDGMPAGESASSFPLPTLPSAEVTAWPLTTGASRLGRHVHSQALSHAGGDFIPKVLLVKEHWGSSILHTLLRIVHWISHCWQRGNNWSRALLGDVEDGNRVFSDQNQDWQQKWQQQGFKPHTLPSCYSLASNVQGQNPPHLSESTSPPKEAVPLNEPPCRAAEDLGSASRWVHLSGKSRSCPIALCSNHLYAHCSFSATGSHSNPGWDLPCRVSRHQPLSAPTCRAIVR